MCYYLQIITCDIWIQSFEKTTIWETNNTPTSMFKLNKHHVLGMQIKRIKKIKIKNK